ncbi:MAG: N,N'-diacetylchitobiose phosphorylase, partial [Eubacteriales bacterium]
HHIAMDNQNFQMSLYAAGSRYENGVIEHDLYYEEDGFQFFTANFEPDGFECLRDKFIGAYRTERNPITVESGVMGGSFEKGGNHCGGLQKKLTLAPGESVRLIYLLGQGDVSEGVKMREKYGAPEVVDGQAAKLAAHWEQRLGAFQVESPNPGLDTMTNIWTLYQSDINVTFSRFSSFIEVGGRTGLGYRDTAQDAMCIPHSSPETCKNRIIQLLRALTTDGYGLHLFDPKWFEPNGKTQSFKSPTVVPTPDKSSMIHGLDDVCADDALWLIGSIVNYVKETGEVDFVNETITYADGGAGTVMEHMAKILEFSAKQVGATGICKGLRADWNDCLNLGGGESSMVSYLHFWALNQFVELCAFLGMDAEKVFYQGQADKVQKVTEEVLWDGAWYVRGITKHGKKIGTSTDKEGKVHMESNTWAVLSGAASAEHGKIALASVKEYLFTPWGLMLNAPPYTQPDDDIGFVTRVYPGLKENGAIFSHPNPWAWAAACKLGDGELAMEFFNSLCPYHQNDKIETRVAEPYSYCQFIVGNSHRDFGKANHPFMTGSAGWAYFASTQYILGIRPDFDQLVVDPCVPADWKEFTVTRKWRGGTYVIHVTNPNGVQKGIASLTLDGVAVEKLPQIGDGMICHVEAVMGA